MTILVNTTITLLIFLSTILSGNPNIVCIMTQNDNLCAKIIIEKPKRCCACKEEKEIEESCSPKSITLKCGISTTAILKNYCQCSLSQPIKSAVLNENNLNVNLKTITRFSNILINTSNKYFSNLFNTSTPVGIHNTISTTILLL